MEKVLEYYKNYKSAFEIYQEVLERYAEGPVTPELELEFQEASETTHKWWCRWSELLQLYK